MNDETRVEDPAAAVMRLEGDLVSPALPAARSKLRDMVSAGIVHVTVDLSDTQMVHSAGIGLLISAHNSLKKAGGELSVIHASKDILDLFRTMRIHQHFSVSGD